MLCTKLTTFNGTRADFFGNKGAYMLNVYFLFIIWAYFSMSEYERRSFYEKTACFQKQFIPPERNLTILSACDCSEPANMRNAI